jgi:hypothetical protein
VTGCVCPPSLPLTHPSLTLAAPWANQTVAQTAHAEDALVTQKGPTPPSLDQETGPYSPDKSSDYQVHTAAIHDGDGTSFLDENWSLLADAQCSGTGAEMLSLSPSQVSLPELEKPGWPNPEEFCPELRNAMMHSIEPITEGLPQYDMNEV